MEHHSPSPSIIIFYFPQKMLWANIPLSYIALFLRIFVSLEERKSAFPYPLHRNSKSPQSIHFLLSAGEKTKRCQRKIEL